MRLFGAPAWKARDSSLLGPGNCLRGNEKLALKGAFG
jgi:hypothetical protein